MFHEYRLASKWAIREGLATADDVKLIELGKHTLQGDEDQETGNTDESMMSLSRQILAEGVWTDCGRPYYNIWPGMLDPLCGVAIEKVDPCHIRLPVPALVLRFPISHQSIRNILVHQREIVSTRAAVEWWFYIIAPLPGDDPACMPVSTYRKKLDSPFLAADDFAAWAVGVMEADNVERLDENREALYQTIYTALTVTVAIALLQDSPDVIVPKPLTADEFRYQKTNDPALIEKARKKGCYQFDVGKDIIVRPGVRVPHFAIRHMGTRPNLKPVLRPIKGSIVNRKLVTSVPTGFLDDEEADDATVLSE